MNLTLLQIVLIFSIIVLFYMVIDAWRRDKLRIFHLLVFSVGLIAIGFVAFNPQLLSKLGTIVGVERGADFLVYMSIIGLGIVVFSLIQYSITQQQDLTRLSTAFAIREYNHNHILPSHIEIAPPSSKDSYLFMIRAYNESTVLGSVIDEIIHAGFSKILICNDGSKDTTEEIVGEKIKQYPNQTIISLSHLINRGPGAANKTLFAFAKQYMSVLGCQRAVSYDADGQMDINDMSKFMKFAQLNNNYDIIFGSRFIKGGQTTNIPLLRKIILQGGRLITYIFNGIRLTDVSTGYRIYNHKAINSITITSDRFSYQNDIIESVHREKLTFCEIPVHIKYTEYSLHKGQSNISAFKILVRLIYSSLFQR